MALNIAQSTGDKLRSARAAVAGAHSGPKKDAASAHLLIAEEAQSAKDESACVNACNEVTRALA